MWPDWAFNRLACISTSCSAALWRPQAHVIDFAHTSMLAHLASSSVFKSRSENQTGSQNKKREEKENTLHPQVESFMFHDKHEITLKGQITNATENKFEENSLLLVCAYGRENNHTRLTNRILYFYKKHLSHSRSQSHRLFVHSASCIELSSSSQYKTQVFGHNHVL